MELSNFTLGLALHQWTAMWDDGQSPRQYEINSA